MKLPKRRELLIYLIFVMLAAVFWIFQAADQYYEQEISVPLQLTNVPNNVVITSEVPQNIRIRVRDRGVNLLGFVYGHSTLPTATIDFAEYQNDRGHFRVLTSELLKPIVSRYDFTYLGARPDTIEVYFNHGLCKRVPVRWQGSIVPAEGYSLADVRLSRDSVLVYASKAVLDTITAAWLQPINVPDVVDTLQMRCVVTPVKGAKFTPSAVDVHAFTDRMVEKSVQVPVRGVNFPAGKHLETFPAKVTVTFQVGMKMYREVTESNFILVVNYEDLLNSADNHCHLALKSIPVGVRQVKITPEDVEFIIEEKEDE